MTNLDRNSKYPFNYQKCTENLVKRLYNSDCNQKYLMY